MFVKKFIFIFGYWTSRVFLKIALKFKSLQVTYYDEFPIKSYKELFFLQRECMNVYIDERAVIKTHDDE